MDQTKRVNNKIQEVESEQELLRELEVLQGYDGEDQVITSKQAMKEIQEEMNKPVEKYFSKIPTLDKMIDGFRQGDLVVFSGPTKHGKTSLAQTITHGLAEEEISCLWFSYELTLREFLEKFGEPLPYFQLPKKLKGNSLDWLEQRIIESIAKYGTKVVFIDHLHYLLDMSFIGQRGNVSLLIGAIMRQLKQIALKWNIAICIVAHTSKINFERQPSLNDIRDSSFISQEADTVLMIWRMVEKANGMFGNRACLAVLANRRNGKVGNIILQMKDNRFYEETDNYEDDNQ